MRHPLLYEINTRCWLNELSQREGRAVTLANAAESEFNGWQRQGFTHIWLMGVWTCGPQARAEALANRQLRQSYAEVLPDWREEDVGGSPYAIADYRVPQSLGGEEGLKSFRAHLASHGLKLLLDFVPNHLGHDHSWLRERPELFVQGTGKSAETFQQKTAAGPRWLAYGKDPYFPSWTDTVQLDYRTSATQTAMRELLLSVGERCDGVRCDMAMLVLKDVFAKTWERFPGAAQPTAGEEFWATAIASVKQAHPEFLFLAEAYWGLEWRLQELGFDYTYDKTLYDRLVSRQWGAVQPHLLGLQSVVRRDYGSQRAAEQPEQRLPRSSPAMNALTTGAHFLENHDEPRIASVLWLPEHRPAALLILGLPGMRFLHEGQLSGATKRTPVQLLRRAQEPVQREVQGMYEQLLRTLPETAVGQGNGLVLVPCPAWPENPTAQNIVVVQWQTRPDAFDLVTVNFAAHRSQCYVHLCSPGLSSHDWSMKDLLGTEEYTRRGAELAGRGLYLDLAAHAAQLFRFRTKAE